MRPQVAGKGTYYILVMNGQGSGDLLNIVHWAEARRAIVFFQSG